MEINCKQNKNFESQWLQFGHTKEEIIRKHFEQIQTRERERDVDSQKSQTNPANFNESVFIYIWGRESSHDKHQQISKEKRASNNQRSEIKRNEKGEGGIMLEIMKWENQQSIERKTQVR